MGRRPRWGRCLSGLCCGAVKCRCSSSCPSAGRSRLRETEPPRRAGYAVASRSPRAARSRRGRGPVRSWPRSWHSGAPLRSVKKWGRNGHGQQGSQSLVGLRRSTCGRNGGGRTFLPRSGGVRVALLAPLTWRGRRGEECEGSEKPEGLLLPVARRGKTACFYSLEGT